MLGLLKKDKPMADVLIAEMGPSEKSEELDLEVDEKDAKRAAVSTLMTAIKAEDADGVVEALSEFVKLCESYEDESEE